MGPTFLILLQVLQNMREVSEKYNELFVEVSNACTLASFIRPT
jgi:hypothetical protein